METIKFELRLPNGANGHIVIVAGGADADHDRTVEDNGEISVFKRMEKNLWTVTQEVQRPTLGMLFAVQITVGRGTQWELVIKNKAEQTLYSGASTTSYDAETISYFLQL
jgi:redox-sensitive bicupin YhaK (pirin superfamily)